MKAGLGAALCGLTLAATLGTGPALAGDVDVGVSIGISQPGVYGRIDIGRYPPPLVYATRPVVIAPRYVAVRPVEPVYMWVPYGHRKNWRKHCGAYGACGAPVMFVRDEWYGGHVHGPRRGGKHDAYRQGYRDGRDARGGRRGHRDRDDREDD